MILKFESLTPSDVYYAMIQAVVPRPIAWVLSENANGSQNLAPFSYFNGVCSNPPLLSLSVGRKGNGSQKDTWHNIENRNHFVIHIPHKEMAEAVSESAANLAEGVSEIEHLGLETTQVDGWPLPRLKETRVAFLCERFAIHTVGSAPQGLILGRVSAAYLDDSVAKYEGKRLKIDARKLDPLARLGGNDYTTLGEILTIARPN